MRDLLDIVTRTIKPQLWWVMVTVVIIMAMEVTSLNGPNVCMVRQKYNITKRVKYRAPMSVRTYEWCFSIPPRCSRWNTEMKDLTRLETEERTAEMAVCCAGYKMRDVSCVAICPNGKTGPGCSEDCPPNKWGPNCVHDCKACKHGVCLPTTGECRCQDGWQGESCETRTSTMSLDVMRDQLLTTTKSTLKTTTPISIISSTTSSRSTVGIVSTMPMTPGTILPTTAKTSINTTQIMTPITLKENIEAVTSTVSPVMQIPNVVYDNMTLLTIPTSLTTDRPVVEEVTKRFLVTDALDNRIETTVHTTRANNETIGIIGTETTKNRITTDMETSPSTMKPNSSAAVMVPTTENSVLSTMVKTSKETTTFEMTRRSDTTMKVPTTLKFKPKEIWIRPAQKGEHPLVESKVKPSFETPKYKGATKKETAPETTTTKTIIVSIIPTSVSYATFKKLALTTATYILHKNNVINKSHNKSADHGSTNPMIVQTTTSIPLTLNISRKIDSDSSSIVNPFLIQNVTKTISYTSFTTKGTFKTTTFSRNRTNSMTSTMNVKQLNSSNPLTTISSTNVIKTRHTATEMFTPKHVTPFKSKNLSTAGNVTEHPSISKQFVAIMQRNVTMNRVTETPKVTKTIVRKQVDTNSKKHLTNYNSETNTVTDEPSKDEEVFHILTEPEHITAVMGDKGTERSSVDLISVISIAGGVMMAIITVAVVIVMLERCKKPRYEDVRKYNDIRMQVMIDNNDVPPPYVRSIFHTPLPDPPTTDKCHYQPISTLDRNLKQFMRPVVVQTISPLMLENFRGILECHYDHLPRRSHEFGTMQPRCHTAPSMEECQELLHQRTHSLTDSDIEALKCEAKLDVIDNTTSEPLYAEIPCWRPPSEHAIEIVNLNGEAVTEL